jgi:DNA-binding LacI/PurR family transcriptional regulator
LSCRDCLEQTGIPYVYLNRMQPGAGYVSCNNFRGMETLAGHVLARGRTRPGYLGWKIKPVNADG